MMKRIFITALCLLLLLGCACAESPTEIGGDSLQDCVNRMPGYTLSVSDSTSTITPSEITFKLLGSGLYMLCSTGDAILVNMLVVAPPEGVDSIDTFIVETSEHTYTLVNNEVWRSPDGVQMYAKVSTDDVMAMMREIAECGQYRVRFLLSGKEQAVVEPAPEQCALLAEYFYMLDHFTKEPTGSAWTMAKGLLLGTVDYSLTTAPASDSAPAAKQTSDAAAEPADEPAATDAPKTGASYTFRQGEAVDIMDENGVRVELTGDVTDSGIMVMELKAIIYNNSSEPISIMCGGTVNGWAMRSMGMGSGMSVVPAGAKAKSCIYLNYEELELKRFADLQSMDVELRVLNADTNTDFFTSAPIHVDFGAGDAPAAPSGETALRVGDRVTLDFVDLTVEEIGVKSDLKFSSKSSGIKITSGPSQKDGQSYAYVQFALRNTHTSKYGVQIAGGLTVGDYTYSADCFTCKMDASPGNVVEPLNDAHCVVYALVPDEVLATGDWTLRFSFGDLFEYGESTYRYAVGSALPAAESPVADTPVAESPADQVIAAANPSEQASAANVVCTATVVSKSKPVSIRKTPDSKGKAVGKAPKGATVNVLEKGGWALVEYEGTQGYIDEAYLSYNDSEPMAHNALPASTDSAAGDKLAWLAECVAKLYGGDAKSLDSFEACALYLTECGITVDATSLEKFTNAVSNKDDMDAALTLWIASGC